MWNSFPIVLSSNVKWFVCFQKASFNLSLYKEVFLCLNSTTAYPIKNDALTYGELDYINGGKNNLTITHVSLFSFFLFIYVIVVYSFGRTHYVYCCGSCTCKIPDSRKFSWIACSDCSGTLLFIWFSCLCNNWLLEQPFGFNLRLDMTSQGCQLVFSLLAHHGPKQLYYTQLLQCR